MVDLLATLDQSCNFGPMLRASLSQLQLLGSDQFSGSGFDPEGDPDVRGGTVRGATVQKCINMLRIAVIDVHENLSLLPHKLFSASPI